VRLKVDVIVTVGSAVLPAMHATSTIPIVFAIAVDPLEVAWSLPWRDQVATLRVCLSSPSILQESASSSCGSCSLIFVTSRSSEMSVILPPYWR